MIPPNTVCSPEVKRPALRYFGSKWRIAPWIISQFPEHSLYCEPFCGGASVLLRKRPAPIEVINDLSTDVWTFFTMLRTRGEELIAMIKLTPYSRLEFDLSWLPCEDPLERARRFYVRCCQGFNSANPLAPTGWKTNRTGASRKSEARVWMSIEHLHVVVERLRTVLIEHGTAADMLVRYDSPAALFYLDPPYLPGTRDRRWNARAYEHDLDELGHLGLLSMLQKVKGKVVISGYPDPLYDSELRGWSRVERPARTIGSDRVEVLWMNYQPAEQTT